MPPTTRAAAKLAKSNESASTARSRFSSRMLDLSATPESTLAISERNKNESLLLKLPSEVLSKILQKVVANQTVHVLPEGSRKYKTRICASPEDCPTSESPRIHLARDDNTVSDGMEDDSCYTIRHEGCANNITTKSGLNLDVLCVCRRIYREASLLPFQENTFVFGLHAPIKGPPPTMAGFVNRLKREQREAIRHVTIATGKIRIAEVKSQIGQLRGLWSLHMLVAPGGSALDFLRALPICLGFATTYRMGFLPLKKFRLNMEAYLDRLGLDSLWIQAPELGRLVRYVEAMFLHHNSNVTEAKTALLEFQEFGDGDRYFTARLKELSGKLLEMLYQDFAFIW